MDKVREQFEAYRDKRNAELEAEGHKPHSKWHITNTHYPTWEASRETVLVELPKPHYEFEGDSAPEMFASQVVAAIEAQGLKVKS